MLKQLLRAENTAKISMVTTIQINSLESLTKMEIIPAKQDTAMEATEVTVAIKAVIKALKVKINSADTTEAKTKTNLVVPLSIMVKADIKAETIPTAAMAAMEATATMVQPIITMVTNTPIVRKEEIGGII